MNKYNCDVCGLEVIVKGETNGKPNEKLSLDFKEGDKIISTWNVCEVCAGHLVNALQEIKKSGREFYNNFKG